MKIKIYHNPRWGKSRNSVRILEEKKIEYEVVEYLKNPLTKAQLQGILNILKLQPKDIVRTSESDFTENDLDKILDNDDEMLNAIIQYPKILERPIIINNNRGVIGRPPEKILEII